MGLPREEHMEGRAKMGLRRKVGPCSFVDGCGTRVSKAEDGVMVQTHWCQTVWTRIPVFPILALYLICPLISAFLVSKTGTTIASCRVVRIK